MVRIAIIVAVVLTFGAVVFGVYYLRTEALQREAEELQLAKMEEERIQREA